MSRPRIGLALGSGAARGLAHIGVIRALAEAGIEPDIVCGSSIGAIVGASYAAGKIEALEDWVRTITWREIVSLLDVRFSSGGLIEGERLIRFLSELLGDVAIENLAKPFAAIATDFHSGREIWLKEGALTEALRASIALPGLFSPAKVGDRWLVDGGIVNPVPVSPCRALGADIVIAVNLNGDLVSKHSVATPESRVKTDGQGPWPELLEGLMSDIPSVVRGGVGAIAERLLGPETGSPGYFDVIFGSVNIMQDHITRSRMAGDPPDVMLTPRLNQIGLLEFNRAEAAIEEGRRSVQRMLPALKDAVGFST
ncbi:MAG: patatin-like phospholipase RssA [Proteobacteria bacterium]|nr:patatin-like phospholipase RssA [Pseudomonadota bacterium]